MSHTPDKTTDTGALLAAGVALASTIKNPHQDGIDMVLVPNGFALQSVERPALPFRREGEVKMYDAESFIRYFMRERNDASLIYASITPAQFVGVFNEHNPGNHAGWRDYKVSYTPTLSREWQEWTGHNKQPFNGNEAFAYWLEDHLPDIVKPTGAELMEIAINFKATSTASFSNPVRLQNGSTELTYSQQVDGSANVKSGKVAIPETFKILVPVFEGVRDVKKYEVEARLRYSLGGGLKIRFELVRPHKVVEQAFTDLLSQIAAGTKQDPLFGKP